MARHAEDRENLLQDATALLPRVQLECRGNSPLGEVFAGFRGPALSIYLGPDSVYHFNSWRELRRAFVDGHLLKAHQRQLLQWTPTRTASEVAMLSRPLTSDEFATLGERLEDELHRLQRALRGGDYKVVGEVPAEGETVARLQEWLEQFAGLTVARSARVGD